MAGCQHSVPMHPNGGPSAAGTTWAQLNPSGWTEADSAGLKGPSTSLGLSSTLGAAAGVHGLMDGGRDACSFHGETALLTHTQYDLARIEFWLKWSSTSGGTGGGYFEFIVGLLTNKTVTAGQLGAATAVLGVACSP